MAGAPHYTAPDPPVTYNFRPGWVAAGEWRRDARRNSKAVHQTVISRAVVNENMRLGTWPPLSLSWQSALPMGILTFLCTANQGGEVSPDLAALFL